MKRISAVVVVLGLASIAHAQPLTTAFTYQAELKNGGAAAVGLHDFRFRLYDDLSAGVQCGPTLCADNITVSQGRFAVELDFGPQFTGQRRYLEIEVRADTGQNCSTTAGFTILGPRQEIVAAPNATFALSAASAANASSAANATQLSGQPASFYTDAANLTGTLPSGGLAGAYGNALTLGNAANSFTGSGAGLTALDAGNLATGTVPSARLAGAYTSALNLSNPANVFAGSGSALTLLNAGNISSGTIADSHLSLNVVRLNTQQVFTVGLEVVPTNGENPGEFRTSVPSLAALLGFSTATSGNGPGLIGTSAGPSGGAGVKGQGTSATGNSYGGYFTVLSTAGIAGYGEALTTSAGTTYGFYGLVRNTNSAGVRGEALASTGTSLGVWGIGPSGSGWGVFSEGRLGASGTKLFRIDHPADPTNKWLMHYCSEGPEPLNIYTGTVTTDGQGYAVISLPDYFDSINRDPRVQLTVDDESDEFVIAKVVGGVKQGLCRVRTSKPKVKVYWEVKAVRNDLWVRTHGAPVEQDKAEHDKGKYQHPELYGLPREQAASYRKPPSDGTDIQQHLSPRHSNTTPLPDR